MTIKRDFIVIEEVTGSLQITIYKISPETKKDLLQQDYQHLEQNIYTVNESLYILDDGSTQTTKPGDSKSFIEVHNLNNSKDVSVDSVNYLGRSQNYCYINHKVDIENLEIQINANQNFISTAIVDFWPICITIYKD